ncbi:MAG: hypothetical protein PHU85_03065 [Phycisphaerae bacterium]|nr:hypothetical protein [Phycisphaerae bacterium]
MMAEDLKAIHEKLDQIILWQNAHTVEHRTVDRDMEEYRETLFGNGRPGLKADVQSIKQTCDAKTCASPIRQAIIDMGVKVLAGAILMFIGWLLFVAEFIHKLQTIGGAK